MYFKGPGCSEVLQADWKNGKPVFQSVLIEFPVENEYTWKLSNYLQKHKIDPELKLIPWGDPERVSKAKIKKKTFLTFALVNNKSAKGL